MKRLRLAQAACATNEPVTTELHQFANFPRIRAYSQTLNYSQNTTEKAVDVDFDQPISMRPFPTTCSRLSFVRRNKRSQ